jgi:hypothetical protein
MTLPVPRPSTDVSVVPGRQGSWGRTRVFKFVNLCLRRIPSADHTIYVLTCLMCAASAANDTPELSQDWALEHAGKTGHQQYAEDMRTFWEVVPEETYHDDPQIEEHRIEGPLL